MNGWRAFLLAGTLILGGCSDGGEGGAQALPSPSASFPIATVLLDNGDESTLVTVEVAETPEQQERVLGARESLAADEGIVFVFFQERDEGLSVADTAVPLSVAFFDATGTIVGILDVDACTTGACTSDAPKTSYMGALAVNQGAFDDWAISEGDHLQLTR